MNTAPPFSAIAQVYDADFSASAVGRLQRGRVWHQVAPHIRSGMSVLELNCGTGEDAVWLAHQGCQVLATDASPAMVAVTVEKIRQNGLEALASACVCPFSAIEPLQAGPFDLILSNFGGLNCIAPEALAQLWNALSKKLKPGGQIIAVVMGRCCAWESLYFLLKGKPRAAFRRLRKGPVSAPLNQNTRVDTWYYSPGELRTQLSNTISGQLVGVYPIGLWLPPSYLDPFFVSRPQWLRALAWLERMASPPWMNSAADHFLLHWKKSGEAELRHLARI